MEKDILIKIEENNKLLKENLDLSRENAKKIKKIHAYMRRTFIARIFYWVFIILVTAGALYAIKPYVKQIIESYNSLQDKVEITTDFINNPGNFFKDIGVLNKLLEEFKE
jgi:type II secretory pathway component PulF